MVYKKKITVLSLIIAALAIAYLFGWVFDPQRMGSRSAAFTWLDPKLTGQISKITINSSGEIKDLVRKNNEWFVSYNGTDYPARRFRVEDFISVLTKRAPYPVQSSNAASHTRLGIADEAASRITVSGGSGLPLLDLLLGQADITGQNIYLRRQGQNEVRSGEDTFTAYVNSARNSWYNLRLFPESETGKLDSGSVQRLSVYVPADGGTAAEPRVFTRSGTAWTFSGISVASPDMGKVDAYVSVILNTEGDDFGYSVNPNDPMFGDSRISLEFGDGSIKTIRLAPPGESGHCYAQVTGSSHVYSIPSWAVSRLFSEDFEKDQ
ncbi:MAG: DUF4340 domain-containing protein [Treponema sp.]|jgi:hypothetical protein|nr:DUF4340 domain-containing protein [Treponema sp.]